MKFQSAKMLFLALAFSAGASANDIALENVCPSFTFKYFGGDLGLVCPGKTDAYFTIKDCVGGSVKRNTSTNVVTATCKNAPTKYFFTAGNGQGTPKIRILDICANTSIKRPPGKTRDYAMYCGSNMVPYFTIINICEKPGVTKNTSTGDITMKCS